MGWISTEAEVSHYRETPVLSRVNMDMTILRVLWFAMGILASINFAVGNPQLIRPGELWPDDRGQYVQAHGGGVIKLGDTYFWFGEDRSQNNDPHFKYVACYSSTDLAHWTFRHQVVKLADVEHIGPKWVLERPKVYYNAPTKKYVMYAHIDAQIDGKGGYSFARVAVFNCDTVDGDYRYLRSFRPLGCESRDIGQFIDDDGTAYLIFEDRPHGFHIAKLSDDYLDVVKDVHLFRKEDGGALEGGAVAHVNGLYYVVGSHLTGWKPNPNLYATAPRLDGPWTPFEKLAPGSPNTYGSQSTMLLKVTGSKTTSVIFMGDIWKPSSQWDSRYLWMPLQIESGKFFLPPPHPFSLNVATGETTFP